jgi:hypothetical protein
MSAFLETALKQQRLHALFFVLKDIIVKIKNAFLMLSIYVQMLFALPPRRV